MSASTCTVDAGVIVRQTPEGEVLEQVRIDNDPVALACAIEKAGPDPEVVLEATTAGTGRSTSCKPAAPKSTSPTLEALKASPTGGSKRHRDACDLADLLRMNRLPEAWIAPAGVRELRELVRYRAKLVALRSGLKAQVHAVLAKEGVAVRLTELFGPTGLQLIEQARLAPVYRLRTTSLLELIDIFDAEVEMLRRVIAARLAGDRGYHAIQAIGGLGQTLAAVFTAEIGDVTRFSRPDKLCCWAGLTPRHRESDTVVRRGHITQQGSTLVRWAAIEAVHSLPWGTKLRADRDRIAASRGRGIGKAAAARKLLTLVYYGLRDGHIRCLSQPREAV
jgi:transposase